MINGNDCGFLLIIVKYLFTLKFYKTKKMHYLNRALKSKASQENYVSKNRYCNRSVKSSVSILPLEAII
ncbi:hypothetical protein YN1HA_28520 [Sulfurisphaera ohwakuensis]